MMYYVGDENHRKEGTCRKSRKLLDFVVSQKGIEVDPDKVKAILEMLEPRIENQVQGFLGRLNYISRFISQLTTTWEPLFRLLCKNSLFSGTMIIK